MSALDVKVPDIGDFANIPVIDVLVKVGDVVEVDTPLVTLETEKATLDVPSPSAGKVTAIKAQKGAKVSKGDVIVVLEAGEAVAEKPAAAAPSPSASSAQTPTPVAAAAPVTPAYEPTLRHPALKLPTEKNTTSSAEAQQKVPSSPTGGEGQGEAGSNPATTSKPSPPQPSATAPGVAPPAASLQSSPPVGGEGAKTAHAGPSVRKFAREMGVDLSRVKGSGLKGRITHDDVKAFVKTILTAPAPKPAPAASAPAATGAVIAWPKVPVVDFAKFGAVEIKPLSRIQKISGPRLHASWVNLPHVTQFDQADITDLEELRNQLKGKAAQNGIKLTPLAFVIRACVQALKEFPLFCSSLDESGQNLVLKKYMHVGFAADTPHGLMVPVIHDADRKDVYELARDLADLSAKAREGKLKGAEMSGGCFTVSSLGGIGGTAFTPIINAPEVAILGVSKSEFKPVYKEGGFVPRLILPLSLSYDHRVIDGALGVKFTTLLAQKLAAARGLVEAIP